jgi:crotonobetainyl-CoA:carnitine CoA-transferase CaiB-like acyl-CoA transferase
VASLFAASGRLPRQVGNRHLAAVRTTRTRHATAGSSSRSRATSSSASSAGDRPAELGTIRFRGVVARLEHGDEINAIVSAWVGEHTVEEVLAILGPDGAGVPCAPVSRSTSSSTIRSWSRAA